MEVIVTIASELVYFTCLRDLQPTSIRVIIRLLSTMDIPVGNNGWCISLRFAEDVWNKYQKLLSQGPKCWLNGDESHGRIRQETPYINKSKKSIRNNVSGQNEIIFHQHGFP